MTWGRLAEVLERIRRDNELERVAREALRSAENARCRLQEVTDG